jgi:hypothetical protein
MMYRLLRRLVKANVWRIFLRVTHGMYFEVAFRAESITAYSTLVRSFTCQRHPYIGCTSDDTGGWKKVKAAGF